MIREVSNLFILNAFFSKVFANTYMKSIIFHNKSTLLIIHLYNENFSKGLCRNTLITQVAVKDLILTFETVMLLVKQLVVVCDLSVSQKGGCSAVHGINIHWICATQIN